MEGINSPEFKQRAAEAVDRRKAYERQQTEENALRAAADMTFQSQAESERLKKEQVINEKQLMARQLAQVALSRRIPVNRKWIVEKSHNLTFRNRMNIGRTLAQGWLLSGTYHSREMDTGEQDTWRNELVLLAEGGVLSTRGPYPSDNVKDFDQLYIHRIPHPDPMAYAASALVPGFDVNKIEQLDESLAEFAGIHGLV